MKKTVVVDNGRDAVKAECNGDYKLIKSVVAPARDFNMEVDLSKPEYFWLVYNGKEYFVGELAYKQSDIGTQNRGREKNTETDIIKLLCVSSLYADHGDRVTLLTNIPARDWRDQRETLVRSIKGNHVVMHKAGVKKDKVISYSIDEVFPLPEGAGIFYGYVYNEKLELLHPDLVKCNVLVLDIGDQTVNYITMAEGEYIDKDCGTLDLGLHKANAEVMKFLEEIGLEVSYPVLTDALTGERFLYMGKEKLVLTGKAQEEYDKLAARVINQLQARLNFKHFQYILLAGGGAGPLHNVINNRLGNICNVIYTGPVGRWLNVRGFKVLYGLMTA